MVELPSDYLQEVYDRRAEFGYAAPIALPDPAVDRKFARIMALVSEQLPARSLLDAGCGDGRFLAATARLPNAPDVLAGCDISGRILETAAETIAREGRTAELVPANLERLPFPDEAFDVVLCVQVIEHLVAPQLGVDQLARVLSPGGALVLSTDNADNRVSKALNMPRSAVVRALGLVGRFQKVSFPHTSFTRANVRELLSRSGLVIEHEETLKFHIDNLDVAPVKRVLNMLDRAMSPHGVGDIIAMVARKITPHAPPFT
jgi:2-polyprenyl-3-methyl-5-hydroxy-6-metoxy-1,4-benzoquinol methylase